MCQKTKWYCFYCGKDLGGFMELIECEKMKNWATSVNGDDLCWEWTIHVKQSIFDVCEPCEDKLDDLLDDPTTWKPLLPSTITEYKGRAH